MKKFLFLIISVIFFQACKKEETKDAVSTKLALLAKEYNLKPQTNLNVKATRSFNTPEELEAYLANQTSKIKAYHDRKNLSTQSTSKSALSFSADQGIITNATINSSDANYSSILVSSYWAEMAFPSVFSLKWSAYYRLATEPNHISDIATTMFYSGENFGNYSYSQTSGTGIYNDSYHELDVAGIYTEIYTVGGVFSYYRLFKFTLSANYLTQSNQIGADIDFQPM